MKRKVLLDELHVMIYVPQELPDAKARRIRAVARRELRNAAARIGRLARESVHAEPGEIVVRIADGEST